MFKLGTKALLAGGTAAVIGLGGAAFAFITATGSGTDEGTTAAATGLDLNLVAPVDVSSTEVFGPSGKSLEVKGTNSFTAPLTLSNPSELVPVITEPAGCPDGSFEVVGTPLVTGVSIPGGETDVVGSFVLRFVNDADADQDSCLSSNLIFTWDDVTPSSPTTTSTPSTSSNPTVDPGL